MAQNHIRLQKLVAHNANEVHDYVRDLNDWTTEMGSKEEDDQNKALAEEQKTHGNQFMKEKQYDKAAECYTKGISFDPKNAVLYANRAQTYLNLKRYEETINDCNMTLELNATDSIKAKASFRRAKAYIELKKYDLAKVDLENAIRLDPKSVEARHVLKEISSHIGVKTGGKKVEVNRKAKLPYRIETRETRTITNDDDDYPEPPRQDAGDSVFPKIIHPIDKPPHKQSKRVILPIPVRILGEDKSSKRNSVSLPSSIVTSPVSSFQSMDESGLCSGLEQLNTKEVPPKPATSVQFMLSWKLLKDYPTVRAQYLQTMAPEDYEIFKDSMESSTLAEILDVLVWEFLPRKWDITPHLAGLLKVRRLVTLLMFMPEKDRANARKLISMCSDEAIRNKYNETFAL